MTAWDYGRKGEECRTRPKGGIEWRLFVETAIEDK